jgi:WD40 repeat protein
VLAAVGLAAGLAAALPGGDGAASGATAPPAGYRIVLGSNRDGVTRAYSMLPDGSGLTPLLGRRRVLSPVNVSADGRTIAYANGPFRAIYVSRASGAGFRRVVASNGAFPALSPDGRLLAFTPRAGGIWTVGTNGRGYRRVTRCLCLARDWAPHGKALVVVRWNGGKRYAIVVQPLHAKRRVLVRITSDAYAGVGDPKWSPNGRWIAYPNTADDERRNGLWLVRPNGTRRHRITRAVGTFAWSPDGNRLAVTAGLSGVSVLGVDGRVLHRLRLDMSVRALAWSPDGRRLLLAGGDGGGPDQIWVVGEDGSELRRVTAAGANSLVGWTRLAPVLPPAAPIPPSERVVDARTVATRAPIAGLSADDSRVALVAKATAADCEHVALWKLGDNATARFVLPAPCGLYARISDVELAGLRAAWVPYRAQGRVDCDVELLSATVADPAPRSLHQIGTGAWGACKSADPYHLHGDGDLLVFDDGGFTGSNPRLVRVGTGSERCHPGFETTASVCATLRRGRFAGPVAAVSRGLIAIRATSAVAVLNESGAVVRTFPFPSREVGAVKLDGDRLVVVRSHVIESYDVASGVRGPAQPLPADHRLADVDGGVAVLLSPGSVTLLRLDDGRVDRLSMGKGPRHAELEPPGLYHSYTTSSGEGRVAFIPRAELAQRSR